MSEVARLTFQPDDGFRKGLNRAVANYLAQPGVEKRGYRRLHAKAAIIITCQAVSYLALVWLAHNWWQVVLYGIGVALAFSAAAFNIMHDGNHGAFSKRGWVNRLAGFELEIMGGSSYLWRVKHNVSHHTDPNIVGYDDDIDAPPLARFASSQPYKTWYKWQHVYLWGLYCFMTLRWQFQGDFATIHKGQIGQHRLTGFNLREKAAFWGGRALFFGLAFALPIALHWSWHGVLTVLAVYVGMSMAFSFVLTLTFQLAHCTDEAMFTSAADATDGKLPHTWAKHQLLTTTDFCTGGSLWERIVTWYLGGLNYQVVHHLFKEVAHVHYPAIAQIVDEACRQETDVRYLRRPTLRAAVAAHYRHIRWMGQPPQLVGG